MREILVIIAILGIIVCASGCTDNTTTTKTYSGNGVSFSYPGNWEELNVSSTQESVGDAGKALVIVGIEGQDMFGLFKVNVGANQVLSTPSEWLANMKKALGTQYVSSKTITVDGEDGVQLIAEDKDGFKFYYAFWNKNGKGYMALLTTKTESQDVFDSIIDTVKTT
ncbi:MAG: PsbP-related protein [Euryarchaeota archaeon]|jgi:hypothetical protein|uniref:PsbP-related protein n=1 Tax=Methanobacterium sp. MZD130B TaxID=3394378 RepID=UPI0017623A04|nr:PsbP-related protein [Euryarchaeota archaeon]HHT19197.1 hypothetical protein [Methanobacterium sp.]